LHRPRCYLLQAGFLPGPFFDSEDGSDMFLRDFGFSRNYKALQHRRKKPMPPASAVFLLRLLFDPEEGDDMFIRNVGSFSTDYKTLCARRQNSL
jgi:hypothetical protein